MRVRYAPCVLAVTIAGALSALAQDAPAPAPRQPEDLDGIVAKVHADTGVPALGGAIVDLDGLAAIGVAGKRVHGKDEDVTKDDLWHLGSCTKAMTATLLAVLHERGELPLETTLAEALPELREKMRDAWRDVPLSWLLQNRGGVPGNLPARFPELWQSLPKRNGKPVRARDVLARDLLGRAPDAEPGTRYEYSNAGFAIAGHAAEVRLGRPWEDLLRAEVFAPLGMDSAGFRAPGDAKKRDQPFGHRPLGSGALPIPPGPLADNPVAIGPAGIVHGSLTDWAKFVRLHLRGARGEEGLLLAPATFTTLHTPPEGQEYAMGWVVTTRPWARGEGGTGRVLTHAGSNTMWYCVVWMAPEKGFALLATCNVGGEAGSSACDAMVQALGRHLAK